MPLMYFESQVSFFSEMVESKCIRTLNLADGTLSVGELIGLPMALVLLEYTSKSSILRAENRSSVCN